MPQSNITDPNTKRQAAREVLDILSEISTLLVRKHTPPPSNQPPPPVCGVPEKEKKRSTEIYI